jgi:hypothetical protein
MTTSRTKQEQPIVLSTPTPSPVDQAIEAHLRRTAVGAMFAASPPPHWDGSLADWHQLQERAREALRAVSTLQIFDAVTKGWTIRELEAGSLDRGSEVVLATGEVRRGAALPSAITALQDQAIALRRRFVDAGVRIDGHDDVMLSEIEVGFGSAAHGRAVLQQIEAKLNAAAFAAAAPARR